MRCAIHAMFIFLIIMTACNASEEEFLKAQDLRIKRQINSLPLIYPYGGTYKLIIGFSSPIHNKEQVQLLFAVNFQYQYVQFTNITQLSQYYFIKEVSRKERELDILARRDERLVFYKSMSDILTIKGMSGVECVLRAICEAAQYPVEEEGLVGEILHILLSPDYGKTAFDEEDPEWAEAMAPYVDAATAGRQMFDCAAVYHGCPEGQGILEFISTLRDE